MNNKEIIVYGESSPLRSLKDRVYKLTITFSEHEDREKLWKLFKDPISVALIPLDCEADVERGLAKRNKDKAHNVSTNSSTKIKYADKLFLSSFFRNPNVWKAVGTDDEFLKWLRTLECASCGFVLSVVAAHVRRIANGSGVGIKPEYSAIPLCNECHQKQHQHGESALGGKEWFDEQRIKYVHKWCWETVKKQLGYESWSDVPFEIFMKWIDEENLRHFLPNSIKELII